MEIIILGSGTSIPLPNRSSPSLAVVVDKTPLIFDMGPGSLRQLQGAGLDFIRISQIFITHFHPDHTADLIPFLFATRIPGVLKKRKPFAVSGPTGIGDLIHRLQEAYPNWLTLPSGLMTVNEIEAEKTFLMDYDGLRITAGFTDHTPNSLAYRIEELRTKKSVVYSGDTGFCDGIIDLAKGADLLILECSFPDDQPLQGHLTPSEAGRIAAMTNVKQLVLTHFYPECLATDIESQCRKTYKGKLILAEDLMRISV